LTLTLTMTISATRQQCDYSRLAPPCPKNFVIFHQKSKNETSIGVTLVANMGHFCAIGSYDSMKNLSSVQRYNLHQLLSIGLWRPMREGWGFINWTINTFLT